MKKLIMYSTLIAEDEAHGTDYAAVARALDDKLDKDTREYLDMRDEERREREDEGDADIVELDAKVRAEGL